MVFWVPNVGELTSCGGINFTPENVGGISFWGELTLIAKKKEGAIKVNSPVKGGGN